MRDRVDREAATLVRLLATPPTPHKPKPDSLPGVSPKKRGRPAKTKTSLASDPTILALRRIIDGYAASGIPDPGERLPNHLVEAMFRSLPLDICDTVFLPANGTGSPHLALAFKPEFRRYVAFAAEYWLNVVTHGRASSASAETRELSV